MFYPEWWLRAVGYFNFKPNPNPDAIMFAARTSTEVAQYTQTVTLPTMLLSCFITALVFGVGGHYFAKKNEQLGVNNHKYIDSCKIPYNGFWKSHRGYSAIETCEL